MATRSRIGIELEDGVIESIYCHWDGYPENNGKILLEHYQDPNKIKALISLGSISSLGHNVIPSGAHDFDNPEELVTVAYARDRGETLDIRKDTSVINFLKSDIEEFGYLFTKEGEWIVIGERGRTPKKLVDIIED